jgi:two-component system, sensor histidine kinase and response regulator
MPNLDGLEATRQIRHRELGTEEHIPIIALTAHALKGDRERCLESGMDVYLAKPMHKEELLQTLQDFSSAEELLCEEQPKAQAVMNVEAALGRTGGDRELLRELCEVFLDETPSLLDELERSMEEGETAGVCRIAHKLKTSAGTIGGIKACEAALATEQFARTQQMKSVRGLGLTLRAEVTSLRNAVAEFLCAV